MLQSWTENELAYFAGIIDGEGCFCLHGQEHRYASQLQIGNTDPRLMEWIRIRFGGSVKLEGRPNARSKPVWRWCSKSSDLNKLIPEILPYLVIKREQAELFLAYRATVAPKASVGRRVSSPRSHTTAKTTQAVKQERRRIHAALSALNHRGPLAVND